MTNKITKDKRYKTKGGHPVVIYEIHPGQIYSVLGAYFYDGEWFVASWCPDGEYSNRDTGSLDLTEFREELTVTGWVGIYRDGTVTRSFGSKEELRVLFQKGFLDAIKPITIPYYKGEGLDD
jgi:hypothetical protein